MTRNQYQNSNFCRFVSFNGFNLKLTALREHFAKSSRGSQCLALDLLSRIGCVSDGMAEGSLPSLDCAKCPVCDLKRNSKPIKELQDTKYVSRAIFSKLIQTNPFMESRRPRVAAMLALRRLVRHCEDSSFMNLETSGPGQWCLQSLNSSVRELRIAAGRTLGAFILKTQFGTVTDEMIAKNRKTLIALLKSTSDQDRPHLIETRIMAWGQIGRVVSEDELNLVLIKLVEYLGSSNNIVSAFTFSELLNLAESLNTTPRRLFEPFWKSLAYMATKDMIQRPQRSRAIAELLQISVNELLLLIQTHALPWLVLDKRQDVIQRIAEARQEKDVWRPLMDAPNLAATLALLLVQDAGNIEEFTKSRLNEISPHFHSLSLLDLFQSEPVFIALELLKAAGSADEARQPLVSGNVSVLFQANLIHLAGAPRPSSHGNHNSQCKQRDKKQEGKCHRSLFAISCARPYGSTHRRYKRLRLLAASGDRAET